MGTFDWLVQRKTNGLDPKGLVLGHLPQKSAHNARGEKSTF